jgi:hypothetical protein
VVGVVAVVVEEAVVVVGAVEAVVAGVVRVVVGAAEEVVLGVAAGPGSPQPAITRASASKASLRERALTRALSNHTRRT